MALSSGMSVPGFRGRCIVANSVMAMRRGSTTMILAPRRHAFFISRAITGCASVVFEPMISRHSQFWISPMELVIAPLPNDSASPATVGAWQVRAHWSTLFVPMTCRDSFCIR